jgi:multidrug transporter EmrE-like cation transporter
MLPAILVLGHTFFNILGNICFKLSAEGQGWWAFWIWQIAGNLSAFTGTMSYTFSMRFLPLHVAYPLTQGLSVLGVTLIAARLVFNETILPLHWLGILFIAGGIVLLSLPSRYQQPQ